MPVRVRLKLGSLRGATVETSSLLNTGYSGASSKIIAPVRLAGRLGALAAPSEAVESTYDTARARLRS